jgi:hypothetical protein
VYGDASALPDQVFSAESACPGDAGGPPCSGLRNLLVLACDNAFAVLPQAARRFCSLTGPHRTGWSVPMCRPMLFVSTREGRRS